MLLPMTFNIGVIIGPMLGKLYQLLPPKYICANIEIGGLLADPVTSYPAIFGPGSPLGGKEGVAWMVKYPYAFPNLVTSVFLFTSVLALFLGFEEVRPQLPAWCFFLFCILSTRM